MCGQGEQGSLVANEFISPRLRCQAYEMKCCTASSSFLRVVIVVSFFSYSAATHFWLCFLSWLLLSIFVYMVYMPFMCLFLECLFGFIFMISCIFKCLKLGFIFALSHSLSLYLFVSIYPSILLCVWLCLGCISCSLCIS